jgi:hypothetical protein
MKKFPAFLVPTNRNEFAHHYRMILTETLRKKIYKHILTHKEADYFSLEEANESVKNLSLVQEIVSELKDELIQLGWKCNFAHGNTALFIFSSDSPPINCWQGTFLE